MAESVLSLTTLIERPTIIIDDVSYEIMSPDELSVLDHHRLGIQGKALDALMSKPKLNAGSEKRLTSLLRDISDFIMVGVPDDVRAKLSDAMRTEIAEVFTTLPLRKHLTALTKEITATEAATRKAMADLPATEATAEE